MAVPVAIIDASMQTRSPRLCDREVSATHEGMVDVFMPFPTPVTSVRQGVSIDTSIQSEVASTY